MFFLSNENQLRQNAFVETSWQNVQNSHDPLELSLRPLIFWRLRCCASVVQSIFHLSVLLEWVAFRRVAVGSGCTESDRWTTEDLLVLDCRWFLRHLPLLMVLNSMGWPVEFHCTRCWRCHRCRWLRCRRHCHCHQID